jgi:hypothetical protein
MGGIDMFMGMAMPMFMGMTPPHWLALLMTPMGMTPGCMTGHSMVG